MLFVNLSQHLHIILEQLIIYAAVCLEESHNKVVSLETGIVRISGFNNELYLLAILLQLYLRIAILSIWALLLWISATFVDFIRFDNVVASGAADRAEVQVAYAIGVANPVGIYLETFGTEKVATSQIESAIRDIFDLRPRAIVEQLDLLRPIYSKTAAYGHFGRELPEFGWEKLDRVDALRSALNL